MTSSAETQRPKPTGRPSKGRRHVMTARIPKETAELVFRLAAARGIAASDWVNEAVTEKLARTDLSETDPQGAFELDQAS